MALFTRENNKGYEDSPRLNFDPIPPLTLSPSSLLSGSIFSPAVRLQVYLAAGAVYGLEGELGDLEDCARSINSGTSDRDLAFLEDQVATAAAQVQQSELQVGLSPQSGGSSGRGG